MCLDFFVLQLSTNFMLATLFCAVGTEHEFVMLFRARFSHYTLDGTFFCYFPMSLSSIFAIYFSFNAFIFFRGVSGWLVGWMAQKNASVDENGVMRFDHREMK